MMMEEEEEAVVGRSSRDLSMQVCTEPAPRVGGLECGCVSVGVCVRG